MSKAVAQAKRSGEETPKLADDAETAEYIGDLVTQLERLARTHGLVRLQYLLGACREEAQKISAPAESSIASSLPQGKSSA